MVGSFRNLPGCQRKPFEQNGRSMPSNDDTAPAFSVSACDVGG